MPPRKRKGLGRPPAPKFGRVEQLEDLVMASAIENSLMETESSTGNSNFEFSPAVSASITSLALPPPSPKAYHPITVPLLHPYMLGKTDVDKIFVSRSRAAVEAGGKDLGASHEDRYALAGVLELGLDGPLNLGGILADGQHSVSLYLGKARFSEEYHLKLKAGEQTWFFSVNLDQRFASQDSQETWSMLNLLQRAMKFYISHDVETPVVSKIQVEVWAVDKICNFVLCSDTNDQVPGSRARSVVGSNWAAKYVQPFMNLLYPDLELDNMSKLKSAEGPAIAGDVVTEVQRFYRAIQQHTGQCALPRASEPDGLAAWLRGYQQQAVTWMLERERVRGPDMDTLHELWRKVCPANLPPALADVKIYFNPFVNKLSHTFFPRPALPRGGILADEMGLGKTVEVLSVILAHRWSGPSRNAPSNLANNEIAILRNQEVSSNETSSSPVGNSSAAEEAPSGEAGANPPASGPSDGPAKENSPEIDSGIASISCICGAVWSKSGDYLVQCERCCTWQHVDCAGYSEEDGELFVCTTCLLKEPLPCKTTLIVCPRVILNQWVEEIEKHVQPNTLKIMKYPGVSSSHVSYVSPLKMAACDVVLTSYEILRLELYHAQSQHFHKKLRHPKRFESLPSPLPALRWWRICLDEAQMVESKITMAAEMMQSLSAENRWCVTGTPVQKDLKDLFGLLLFLKVDTYQAQKFYCQLLLQPLLRGDREPITSLFSRIMWRNTMDGVEKELRIPPLSEKVHWVQFTNVEEYFYRRQREVCVANIRRKLTGTNPDTVLSSMHHSYLKEVLNPLHSLRQACCTPQMVKSGYLFREPLKAALSMTDLLSKLTKQSQVEAREDLRQMVASLNGLAGLHLLRNMHSEAVCYYKEAIDLWREYKERDVECDKLQRIHCLESLAGVLKDKPEVKQVVPEFCEDDLMKQAQELRKEYSRKALGQLRASNEALIAQKMTVEKVRKKTQLTIYNFLHKKTQDGDASEGVSDSKDSAGGAEASVSNPSSPIKAPTSTTSVPPSPNSGDAPTAEFAPPTEDSAGVGTGGAKLGGAGPLRTSTHKDIADVATESGIDGPTSLSSVPPLVTEDTGNPQRMEVDEPTNLQAMDTDLTNSLSLAVEPDITGAETNSIPPPAAAVEPDITGAETNSIPPPAAVEPDVTGAENDSNSLPDSQAVPLTMKIVTPCKGSGPVAPSPAPPTPVPSVSDSELEATPLWWDVLAVWCDQNSRTRELLEYINRTHAHNPDHAHNHTPLPVFHSLFSLTAHLTLGIQAIEDSRKEALKSLDSLSPPPSEELVIAAANCHLVEGHNSFPNQRCYYCQVEWKMLEHENQVFLNSTGEVADGSRAPSLFENIVKSMVTFCQRSGLKELCASGRLVLSYLGALRKEYPAMRTVWLSQGERLGMSYELQQASTKMCLSTEEEIVSHTHHPQAVCKSHIPYHVKTMLQDKANFLASLKRKVGTVMYLKNLEKYQYDKNGNQEVCPICTIEMGKQWGVFPCGHTLCATCTKTLLQRRAHSSFLNCPICRLSCIASDINYVRLGEGGEEKEEVKGIHASKIVSVVQTLLRIRKQEPRAKALVFSWWQEVLLHIQDCLSLNNVPYHIFKTSSTFSSQLSSFKTSPDINVLLLPYQMGSKGLNIVEATHVLLVEPQLNVSAELQAIGRIHRMGQTRPTTVHRFVVKDTVEEKLHKLFHGNSERRHSASQVPLEDSAMALTCGDITQLVQTDSAPSTSTATPSTSQGAL